MPLSAKLSVAALCVLFCITGLQAYGQGQPQGGGTLTVKLDTLGSQRGGFVETAKAVADLASALAWPALFGILLITQRDALKRLFESLIEVVRFSTRIKLGDMIDLEVDRSAKQAGQQAAPTRDIPAVEVEAASRVDRLVGSTDLPGVRARMIAFAREYEGTRSSMAPGPPRTRAMNAVVAKMRTLAMAAKPLLAEFAESQDSPGMRLVAISILQLSPDLEYLDWLVKRMSSEQPFVFFQASVAILAIARSYGTTNRKEIAGAAERALKVVNSFGPGPPDRNTVDTLQLALSELGAS
jgi:hypothetical protein